MENQNKDAKTEQNTKMSHQILLQNRNNVTMTGITRVDSTSENSVDVMIGDTPLEILGNNIHVLKLDVEKGILELEGNFVSIKYDVKDKKNFVQRLFR